MTDNLLPLHHRSADSSRSATPAPRFCGEVVAPGRSCQNLARTRTVIGGVPDRADVAVFRCEAHAWSLEDYTAVQAALRAGGLEPVLEVSAA